MAGTIMDLYRNYYQATPQQRGMMSIPWQNYGPASNAGQQAGISDAAQQQAAAIARYPYANLPTMLAGSHQITDPLGNPLPGTRQPAQHPAFQGGPVPAPVPQAPPMPVNDPRFLGPPQQAPGLGAQQPGFLGLPQQAGQQGPGFGQGFGHWLGLLQSGQLGQLPPGLARKPMFQPNQQTGMVNQGTNLVGGM